MKKYCVAIFLMLFGLVPTEVLATTPPELVVPSGLSLAEIKITGNEFVMLQNNTGSTISDLANYWLYNFNNTDPTIAGTSSSSQQLPVASLAVGQTILLSANGGATCGAAVTAKLSISLTDTSGFLQVVHASFSGGVLTQTAGDSVSWASSSSSPVYNTPAATITVPTSTADKTAYANYRYQNFLSPLVFWWQPASQNSTNICQLNVAGVSTPGPTNPGTALLPGSPPPATIISLSDDPLQTQDSETSGLPPTDVGLAAPQINEILPNPAEPQTDSEDEFIELYNSNDAVFDLTGFKLETGTSTLHRYSFSSGTSMPPKSFVAFPSVDTNMSLSNSGGQARLIDPFGNVISQSDAYSSAPDGQSWALAGGKWYWTTSPTSNAANVIVQPLSIKSLSVGSTPTTASTTKTSTTAVKTTAAAAPKVKAASSTNTSSINQAVPSATPRNLHPLVLAGVGAGAVAYAAYEYRNDLANRLHQLRRYREARRAAGTSTKKS